MCLPFQIDGLRRDRYKLPPWIVMYVGAVGAFLTFFVAATLEENDIFPGSFEGTLTHEKESGSFSAYDYKIAYAHNETDEGSGDVRATTMEFKANGYS